MAKIKKINKKEKSKKQKKIWLITGIISYLIISTYSIIASLDNYSFFENIYLALEWFAACIIYFFIGALIGFIIDLSIAKLKNENICIHLWIWFLLFLYLASLITLFTKESYPNSIFIAIIYPLAYGIFFIGAAFVKLSPLIIKTNYSKLVFDLIVILLFSIWINFSYKSRETIIEKIILSILFIILTIGAIYAAILFSI